MRPGDATNDNVITVLDFNVLKSTFGRACGDAGYGDRADFTGDCLVSIKKGPARRVGYLDYFPGTTVISRLNVLMLSAPSPVISTSSSMRTPMLFIS